LANTVRVVPRAKARARVTAFCEMVKNIRNSSSKMKVKEGSAYK
jgi:hypothetical protein